MTETENAFAPIAPYRRYNAKCLCGSKLSILVAQTRARIANDKGRVYQVAVTPEGNPFTYDNGEIFLPCPCGKIRRGKPVSGKVRMDKACNARCMSATGHSCECRCGGKNHGAGHNLAG